ncbi:MAG: hypothetical protein HKN26_07760, partial [Acidimicrobiales bacterium]|nr:hypothetical protein [Acidimicrobiales bacterium]
MRAQLADLLPPRGQRGRYARLLTAAAVTGALTALLVAAVEKLAESWLLHGLEGQPLWLIAVAPGFGLLLAWLLLRYGAANATPATSDEYVRAYHSRRPEVPLRDVPAKLLAGVATIGLGGSLGLEGPSIYAGAAMGHNLQERLARFFRRDEAKMLLTAGAAAGVAAVFKAPATGLIFALEAPYRDDVTRRALLPGLLASVTGYVTYVSIIGTTPVVPFIGRTLREGGFVSGIDYSDIAGAVLLGIGAGLAARGVV